MQNVKLQKCEIKCQKYFAVGTEAVLLADWFCNFIVHRVL